MPMSEINLVPRKFEDLCSLGYSFFTCSLPSWPQLSQFSCLVVKFIGECGKDTSNPRSGYDDFICAITKGAIRAWKPVALVLDLRELKYEWGDEMSFPFEMCQRMHLLPSPQIALRAIFEVYPKLREPDLEKSKDSLLKLPFSVIVSDKNRDGLTSLFRQELKTDPEAFLFEKLEEAVDAVDCRLQVNFKKL
jgi:hypothetical protein